MTSRGDDTSAKEVASRISARAHKENAAPVEKLLLPGAAVALVDYILLISLIFGGCCSNAWSLETLLKQSSCVGSALTFSQMTFVAAHGLPSFITFKSTGCKPTWIPRLKPRAVPLSIWLFQVLLLVTISLLNNWALAHKVPLTVHIVVRSSGLGISMMFGYFAMNKTYTGLQILAVFFVTSGVIIATMSGPSSSSAKGIASTDIREYSFGILMLASASILTGCYGMLQEKTYTRYGPHWREGLFYTNLFSLPLFAFLFSDVRHGAYSLAKSDRPAIGGIPYPFFILVLNLITQLMCTSSVSKLTSTVSSVTTNIVLTARKALSLCISVWWFGNGWNRRLGTGASMVFFGTLLYSMATPRTTNRKQKFQ